MTATWWWIGSVLAASLLLLGWRAAGWRRACGEHDALLAQQEALGQQQRDRARLRAARFVAEQWRAWALEDVTKRLFAAHVLACILAALDGETDPDELGIDPGAHEAFRAALAGSCSAVPAETVPNNQEAR